MKSGKTMSNQNGIRGELRLFLGEDQLWQNIGEEFSPDYSQARNIVSFQDSFSASSQFWDESQRDYASRG